MGRDHHAAIACRSALDVIWCRNRDEHVVAIPQRLLVVLEKLVVSEVLTSNLFLWYAQKDDDRSSCCIGISLQIRVQRFGDLQRCQTSGQLCWQCTDHLGCLENSPSCLNKEIPLLTCNLLHPTTNT